MIGADPDASSRPGPTEGILSLAGTALVASSWIGPAGARAGEAGAQLLLAALGWRCGRGWSARARGLTVHSEPETAVITRCAMVVALPVLAHLVIVEHSGSTRPVEMWRLAARPTASSFGHFWVVGAAVVLVTAFALAQRMAESVTARWRPLLAAGSCAVALLSAGAWLSSPAGSTVRSLLGLGRSSWGFAAAVALALSLGGDGGGRRRAGGAGLASFSVVPLVSAHEREARWLVGAFLWGWPAVHVLVGEPAEGLLWLPLLVLIGATIVGGWSVSLVGGWVRWTSVLPSATRRAIGVSATAAVVLIGTSTAVSAGGVAGGPAFRADSAGLLSVAVPELEIVVPRPLEVMLVGDSTMAPMRWFRQGQASLSGFDYVLDAESCRRIAKRSCWGRESRIPTSATLAISSRRRNFDYVVLMAGAHSTRKDLADEIRMAQEAAESRGAKLLVLTLRESQRYTQADAPPGESAFVEFNRIIRRVVDELGPDKAAIIDWNSFSFREAEWFRSDGIHPNLTGTIALGWFISRAIAAEAGNPCPSDWTYPCPVPREPTDGRNWLDEFGVTPTNEHCYEDGNERIPVCGRDRRM